MNAPARHAALVACLAYAATSIMMTLSNKAVMTVWGFAFPMTLMLVQNTFVAVTMYLLKMWNVLEVEELKTEKVKTWLPANLIFCAMLLSAQYALRSLSVPMVTIFKNLTTLAVALGDVLIRGQSSGLESGVAGAMMLASSVIASMNDLSFDGVGYFFMGLNVLFSAAYSLTVRVVIDRTQLDKWSMVYYNSVLSLPLSLLLFLCGDELPRVMVWWASEDLGPTPSFCTIAFLNLTCGVLISASSLWCIKSTSPTTTSIVGSLNKIPLSVLGFWLFPTPVTTWGMLGIGVGLMGGVYYSLAKWRKEKRKSSARIERGLLGAK